MAVPMMSTTLGSFRLGGDARSLANALSLTKLRAAASYSKARLFVDRSTNSFHIDVWQKTAGTWTAEAGTTALSSVAETYSFGVVSTPPPNTQPAIGLAPPCLTAAGVAIGNTSCIVFNSRGIPIDNTGAPTGGDALYLTDGTSVYGLTVSATSSIRLWKTQAKAAPSWVQQ